MPSEMKCSGTWHAPAVYVPCNGYCGRTGGDEFMVFLKDIRDITMIEREGKKIEQFFHQLKSENM